VKILQVCTYGRGGAGKAALSYHRELLRRGIDSTILFKEASQQETGIHTIEEQYGATGAKLRNLKHKLYRKFKLLGKPKSPERYSFPVAPFEITKHPAYQAADLIHLHWTYELLDLPSFMKYNTKPVIWTQHDECILLDGCHCAYGFPFDAYADYSLWFRDCLTQFLQTQKVSLTAPSTWLTNRLKADERTKGNKVFHVPNGLETQHFKVKDRIEARKNLDLPLDRKIILFITDYLDRPLKGLDQFIDLMHYLKELPTSKEYFCLIVGHGSMPKEEISLDYKHLEYVDGVEKMSWLYNAADVYVTPTFADNLPYTVMESLFCGTPVAAFDVGGVSDLVEHGENGLLCTVGDTETLGSQVVQLITEERFQKRQEISNNAVNRFSIERVIPQLIQVYQRVGVDECRNFDVNYFCK